MANTYGMSGGLSGEPYEGEYNIIPTTTDIILDTRDKVIDGVLTIEGDTNLSSDKIVYDSSIFGVQGNRTYLSFNGGFGTTYKNNEVYGGDIINSVTDKIAPTDIGEMTDVTGKYTYRATRGLEYLVAQHGDYYINFDISMSNNEVFFVAYHKNTVVSVYSLRSIVNAKYIEVAWSMGDQGVEDVENGNVVFLFYASNDETRDADKGNWDLYCIVIKNGYDSGSNYSVEKIDSFVGIPFVSVEMIYDKYASVFCKIRNNSRTFRFYLINKDDLKDRKTANFSTSLLDDGYNHHCIYGADGYIYVYGEKIPESRGYYNLIKLKTDGSQVAYRSIAITDLNFGDKTKPTSAQVITYFVNNNGVIFLYYSAYGDIISNCCAIFSTNIASKTHDMALTPEPPINLTKDGTIRYNSSSQTLMVGASYPFRVLISNLTEAGKMIAYKFAYAEMSWALNIANDDKTYFCSFYGDNETSNGLVYLDRSAIKTKIIETDTYTAELEEV